MSRNIPNTNDNYLTIGDVAAIDITGTALTVVCWMKPVSIGAEDALVSKRNAAASQFQYELALGSGGAVVMRVGNGGGSFDTASGGTQATTGAWHHIAGVKNGTGANALKGYIDGVERANATSNVTIGDTAQSLVLGRISDSNNNIADGLLAEVAIWNVALTPAEIAALARGVNPLNVRPGSLKGYWPLWGVAYPEPDLSGGKNNASQVGTVSAGAHAPVSPTVFGFSGIDLWSDTGTPVPPKEDTATVYVDIQVSSAEIAEFVDAATAYVDIQTSGVEGLERVDAATIYIDIQNTGGECFSSFSGEFFGEGEASIRWRVTAYKERWIATEETRWAVVGISNEVGC